MGPRGGVHNTKVKINKVKKKIKIKPPSPIGPRSVVDSPLSFPMEAAVGTALLHAGVLLGVGATEAVVGTALLRAGVLLRVGATEAAVGTALPRAGVLLGVGTTEEAVGTALPHAGVSLTWLNLCWEVGTTGRALLSSISSLVGALALS